MLVGARHGINIEYTWCATFSRHTLISPLDYSTRDPTQLNKGKHAQTE